jgi:hypothetical protein
VRKYAMYLGSIKLIEKPRVIIKTAITTSKKNLNLASIPFGFLKSSISPIHNMRKHPISIYLISLSVPVGKEVENLTTNNVIKKERKTPIPPESGTLPLCVFISFGRSTFLNFNEKYLTTGTSRSEIIKERQKTFM